MDTYKRWFFTEFLEFLTDEVRRAAETTDTALTPLTGSVCRDSSRPVMF